MTTTDQQETIVQRGIFTKESPGKANMAIPDARYPCENEDATLNKGENHLSEYFAAEELFYTTFLVKEYSTIFGGFFCEPCLDGLSIKKRGPSLEEAIKTDTLNRMRKALNL